MTVKKLVCAAGVMVLMAVSPASAHLQQRNDPQGDVAGGRLDMKQAGLGHSETHFSMTVRTWTHWTRNSLEGGAKDEDRYIAWAFDSHGGESIDYGVVVDTEGGQLIAYLLRLRQSGPPDRVGGNIPGLERDGRFVKVSIRRNRLDPRPGHIRWAAQTVWRDNDACSISCYDSRPEQPDEREPTLITHNL